MNFEYSQDQLSICQTIEELSRKKLNHDIYSDDEKQKFPFDKWMNCCECGIVSLPVPEEYGGLAASMLTTALAFETLARTCMDEGLVFSLCAHLCTCVVPVMRFGTEDQKRTYLPSLAAGTMIGGNGTSEAGAGSDCASMQTKAVKKENGYCLDGAKLFVSNGGVAEFFIIYARHPGGMKMADISAFMAEKKYKGIQLGQTFDKMGLRTCPLNEIILTDCEIPSENLLGRERFGMSVFNESMVWERILMAAYQTGAMEQQFDLVLSHAKTRRQFGQRLLEFPEIAGKITAMKLNIETSKLLLYKTCSDFDNGRSTAVQSSMLKLHVSESKVKNSLDALQIFGAYGYMKECAVEKQMRDSLAATIYSGTSEIQKKIIAQEFLKNG